jgi:hypothetical protein
VLAMTGRRGGQGGSEMMCGEAVAGWVMACCICHDGVRIDRVG